MAPIFALQCLALFVVVSQLWEVLEQANKNRNQGDTGQVSIVRGNDANRAALQGRPIPADGFPRVLIAQPCSGSSATIIFTQVILKAHGYDILHGSQPLLRPHQKDRFYDDAKASLKESLARDPTHKEIRLESLILYNKRAILKNQIVLFKLNNLQDDVMDTLQSMNTKFAFTYRRNTLDRAICSVRDCFVTDSPFGHQVFPNGTMSDLCFNRRQSQHKVMAMFDDGQALISYMEEKERILEQRIERYSPSIAPSKGVAYEDLFAFEYTSSEKVLESSVKEWCNLLRSFGDINEFTVKEALTPYWNSRKLEPSHSSVIHNANEIKEALEDSPFQAYFRN